MLTWHHAVHLSILRYKLTCLISLDYHPRACLRHSSHVARLVPAAPFSIFQYFDIPIYIRVVHSSHFWAIFGSFSASFSDHWLFGRRMIRMIRKMKQKMMWKMATVNALKCKHLENELKMHFTYLRQSSAHSNSTSNNLVKLFSWAGH